MPETFSEFSASESEVPLGFILDLSPERIENLRKDLTKNKPRAFVVTEDGDIIVGKTEKHQDIISGRVSSTGILEKGTIVPKAKKINFIYSDNFRSRAVSSQERTDMQKKIRSEINITLGIDYN